MAARGASGSLFGVTGRSQASTLRPLPVLPSSICAGLIFAATLSQFCAAFNRECTAYSLLINSVDRL
jgi:hypothetical protein